MADDELERIRDTVIQEWIETLLRVIERAVPFAERIEGENRLRVTAVDGDYLITVEKEVKP